MKTLPENFEGKGSQKGWQFIRQKREGNTAIYKKSDGEGTYYEVITITIQKETAFKNFIYAEKERYPTDNEFGSFGWTFHNLNSAEQFFKKLALKGVDTKEATLGQKTGLYGSEKQYST